MKKQILSLVAVAAVAIIYSSYSNDGVAHSNSGGAPGPGSCTSCHGGTNQNTDEIFIEAYKFDGVNLDTALATSYEPGANYLLAYGTDDDFSDGKLGYALSVNVGTLALAPMEDESQKVDNYLTHTGSGTTPDGGGKIWGAIWTAPASGTANFLMYINNTNGDGGTSGDVVYEQTLSLSPTATSVKKVLDETTTTVYPNPVADVLNVAFTLKTSASVAINIYSTNGKLVYSQTAKNYTAGSQQLVLPNQLNAGLYLVQVEAGNQIITKRVLVK